MANARKRSTDLDPWMTLLEAAKELKTTRQTVLTRAVKGELEAQHVAGMTVVSRESVRRAKKAQETAQP